MKLHAKEGLAAQEAQVWERVEGTWRRYSEPVLSIDTDAGKALVFAGLEAGSDQLVEKAVSGTFAVRLKEGSRATRDELLAWHSTALVDELLSPLPGEAHA